MFGSITVSGVGGKQDIGEMNNLRRFSSMFTEAKNEKKDQENLQNDISRRKISNL